MVAPVPTSERSDGFQPPSTPKPAFAPTPAPTGRLAAVQEMARWLRLLFETEREFVRTATTLIYRVGEPELKYLLCQHVWEAASHARFLRERGRELSGFGATDDVRPSLRQLFNEAVMPADATVALCPLPPLALIVVAAPLVTSNAVDVPVVRLGPVADNV